ncbi:hypothetical protein [Marinobacter sp. ST-43]|uniref:hypothetical protein n=1 Tax=Marinobacter sp. ST-43 TaxID=3050453 RepID=UPI0026DF2749|nr:hypothetical protein [Marinobacter sp. ST-43]
MLEIPEYKDRIVAFIDILGFEALILSLSKNPELRERIHAALTKIRSTRDSSRRANTAQSDLEINQFSDSIAISAEPTKKGFFSVIWACGWLNADLLYSGILTRGGISVGPTVHESDLIYGEAMLQAYRIESSAAVYPRIVVDDAIFEYPGIGAQKPYLRQDGDGLWFIDPFEFEASCPGAAGLAADGYDPREIYFKELGKHIESGLSGATRVDHRSKWQWLKSRYEAALQFHRSGGKTQFMRSLEMAEQNAAADAEKRR